MDRVAAGGRVGRGGVHGRSFDDTGYAAHAASPSSGHKKGHGRSDSGGGGGGRDRDRDSSSTTRDEFKEYALAVRKRDRRGRPDDEPVESRERGGGGKFRRDKDYTQVSYLVCLPAVFFIHFCFLLLVYDDSFESRSLRVLSLRCLDLLAWGGVYFTDGRR